MGVNHIDRLVEGYRHFRRDDFEKNRELFERLAKLGQSPKTLVVSCCDSRVDPAILTDSDPGDLFVIRNVANLVPPFETGGSFHGTSAALEFGVRHLEVENIIVLGHAQCGGIRALLNQPAEGGSAQGFIGGWMQAVAHARNRVLSRMHGAPAEEQQRACEQEAILVSLDNLLTFPWILERVALGKLTLHGWYFDVARGELLRFDSHTHRFESMLP